MKFSQSDLTKLALGAGAGYLGASLLIPSHRGFAAGGCPWDCTKLNDTQATSQACVDKCGKGLLPWTQAALNRRSPWDKAHAANPMTPDHQSVIYPSGSPAGIEGAAIQRGGSDWSEHNIGAPTRAGLDSIAKGLEQAFKDVQCPPFMSFLGSNCKYWPIILIGGFAGIMILSKI